eukprot:scaffold3146_cov245-Pinguiococcus_pyrenoidosus.AAC.1
MSAFRHHARVLLLVRDLGWHAAEVAIHVALHVERNRHCQPVAVPNRVPVHVAFVLEHPGRRERGLSLLDHNALQRAPHHPRGHVVEAVVHAGLHRIPREASHGLHSRHAVRAPDGRHRVRHGERRDPRVLHVLSGVPLQHGLGEPGRRRSHLRLLGAAELELHAQSRDVHRTARAAPESRIPAHAAATRAAAFAAVGLVPAVLDLFVGRRPPASVAGPAGPHAHHSARDAEHRLGSEASGRSF